MDIVFSFEEETKRYTMEVEKGNVYVVNIEPEPTEEKTKVGFHLDFIDFSIKTIVFTW